MSDVSSIVLRSQSSLPNVQQSIRQGDLLFVRVMKNLGGGNYLASFAGGRFTVKSAADLIAGQTFRARVEIAGGKMLLVPQGGGANSTGTGGAISVQNFSALSPEVAAFLASMGLEADGVAQRILQFLVQSNSKINPALMQKARRLASKYKGKEKEAAEAALILEQKGIDSASDALDEIMELLQGTGESEKDTGGRGKDTESGNRQQKQATAQAPQGNRQDSGFQEPEGLSCRATAQALRGSDDLPTANRLLPTEEPATAHCSLLTAFNSRKQKNSGQENCAWVLLPFDFEIAGNRQDSGFQEQEGLSCRATAQAPQGSSNLPTSYFLLPTEEPTSYFLLPTEKPTETGSGVLRLYLNLEKNAAQKFVINFKTTSENLFFAVYYNGKKIARLEFSAEGDAFGESGERLWELARSLGEGVDFCAVPFEEFSAFASENLPLSAVEGFA